MSEQTQAERLAGVLKRHGDWRYGNGSFIRCDCGEHVGFPDDDAPGKGSRAHATHLAAAVLAHLEAQGWAQGREEWGMQYERRADPTMDNPSGIVTNTMVSAHGETHVRQCIANGLPMSRIGRARAVRRRVTDWEPVE